MGRFSRLTRPEQNEILQHLGSHVHPLEEWLSRLARSDCQVLCLGEFHEESTRQNLSEAFFDRLRVDVLMLEATPEDLERLLKKLGAGRAYFPLLGADIMNVLHAVQRRSPDGRIHGIDETPAQEAESRGMDGSRDRFLSRNFWARFQPGMRHVILIGSLHCANDPNWLFGRLLQEASPDLRQRMVNVKVVGENRSAALQAFLLFLDRVGITKGDKAFVFSDTGRLHPRILQWFPGLGRQRLAAYQALIIFPLTERPWSNK
jgi:hypothetical protein